MSHGLSLGGGNGQAGERFLFIFRQHDVACQAQHLKELHGFLFHVREDNQRAALFRDVDDAEQDGDADAVDQLGVAEIDNEGASARLELVPAFALNFFAGQLVEIVAGIDDGGGADAV